MIVASDMIRGFDRDGCRMVDPPVREWKCRTCGNENAVEVGETRNQSCNECGALRFHDEYDGREITRRWKVRG